MPSLDKRFIALGLLLLLFDGIWAFHLAPQLLHTGVPPGDLVYETDGNSMETFPGPQVYTRYTEVHSLNTTNVDGDRASMAFDSKVYKLPANDLSWSQVNAVPFDRDTLKIIGSDSYVMFPPHLEKQDYRVKLFSYIPDSGTQFRFIRVEEVRGLTAYVFDFQLEDLDWTDNYTLHMPPDVRIKSRDWGTVWIEPTTGLLVNHTEQWVAAAQGGAFDSVEVDAGGMWFSSDTVMKRIFLAQNIKRACILYEIVLPLAMVAVAAILLAMAASCRRAVAPE